jgi:hypothetical protein
VAGRLPELRFVALADISAGERLSIGHGEETSSLFSEDCGCIKCAYYRKSIYSETRAGDDRVPPSPHAGYCCDGALYHLAQHMMQCGHFQDSVRIFAQVILNAEKMCTSCKAAVDVGDAFNGLAAALLETSGWETANKVWCLGFRAYPTNAYLQATHDKLSAYDVFRRADIQDSRAAEQYISVVPSSSLSSEQFFDGFLNRRADGCDIVKKGPLQLPISNRLFVSKAAVVDLSRCKTIIATTEEYARRDGGWTTGRHYSVPTTDVPVHAMPSVLQWFNQLLSESLGPMLCAQFSRPGHRCTVGMHDVFVVKYSAEKQVSDDAAGDPVTLSATSAGQRYLPLHADQSSHSFVIPLNDDYEGGGTYFADLASSVRAPAGHLVSFPGGSMLHAGDPVLLGTRYIIAGFVYIQNNTERVDSTGSSSTSSGCSCSNSSEGGDKAEELLQSFLRRDDKGSKAEKQSMCDIFHVNQDPKTTFDHIDVASTPPAFTFQFGFSDAES